MTNYFILILLFVQITSVFAQRERVNQAYNRSNVDNVSQGTAQDVGSSLYDEWAGKIVSLSSDYDNVFELSNNTNKDAMLGITSNKSEYYEDSEYLNQLAKGLNSSILVKEGVSYVKYSMENGPIKRGDYITLSSQPGIGMKATQDGFTVGAALEDSDNTEKEGLLKIRVMVRYEKF